MKQEPILPHGVMREELSDPELAGAGLHGAQLRLVPLRRGPFAASSSSFLLEDMTLQVGACSAHMCLAAVAPDRGLLHLSLNPDENLLINGVASGPRSFGLYGSGAEVLRSSEHDVQFALVTFSTALVGTLAEAPAGEALLRPGSHTLLRPSTSAWAKITSLARAAGAMVLEAPMVFEGEQPRQALRETLLQAFHELVASVGNDAPVSPPRSSRARKRIVFAADEYLRAHVDRPIYTTQLCRALGVSASALSEAFQSTSMISPHRFLKQRRLGMVRSALLSREGPRPMVKSVALSHGFWHLGQFAQDYRNAFGEAPSATLERIRGTA